MSFFCLLWTPLFYLFWRSVTGSSHSSGGLWAFFAGSVVALFQFFLGSFAAPGGFGVSRWVSGFVDIVCLPVLAPLVVCLLLVAFKVFSGTVNFANFTLLWLIPGGAVRALSWSSSGDPVLLVLVPVLWTAIAAGVQFFIDLCQNRKAYVIVPCGLAMLAVPCAAAFSYWAFYAQKNLLGAACLAAAAASMLVSVIQSFLRAEG